MSATRITYVLIHPSATGKPPEDLTPADIERDAGFTDDARHAILRMWFGQSLQLTYHGAPVQVYRSR